MKVVVVGAGISGLAAAWWIRMLGQERGRDIEVVVLEAGSRLGGTIHTEVGAGFRFEWGPNGFLDSKPDTLRLVEKLGLCGRLLPSSAEAARRFVLVGGELVELPTSPPAFLRSRVLSPGAKLRILCEPLVRRGRDPEETVGAFAVRRLGRQARDRLIDPFVSGIFAGDPDRLSVKAAFPRLVELEQQYGSLIVASARLRKARGKDANAAGPAGRLTSFPGGMSELVQALGGALGDGVRTGAPVHEVRPSSDAGSRRWLVGVAGSEPIAADSVVIAVPAFSAARILAPLDPRLAGALTGIPYAAATVVGLGYRLSDVGPTGLDGFGFLCPSKEKRQILGCLWSSSIFPGQRAPDGHALTRTIVGGARAPDLAGLPGEELVALVRTELAELMGVVADPMYVRISRHEKAIPQYEPGHLGRLVALEAALREHPGLHVTGNALRGIGLNDCTRESEAAARRVVDGLPAGS